MIAAYDKICDVLVEAGIDHIFGIPGVGTIPIWNAFYDRQDKLNAVLTRHEQSASCMAEVYGRVTGRPAVLIQEADGTLKAVTPEEAEKHLAAMAPDQRALYKTGTKEKGLARL